MAGRAIWKGFLHFGDIDVPVKLHAAVKEDRLHFHLLHRPDRVKLQQQMVCAHENVPVPPAGQVKGFPLEDNKYILVEPEELEKIETESSRVIEVHEFVPAVQIAPVFCDQVYYLEPDALSTGYNALAATLHDMAVAGICTWTMRKRSYLGALQAGGTVLRLQTLRYADEVIPVQALDLQEFSLSEKELKIGGDLINQLTVPFQPQKYRNEHQQKLLDLLAKKARGEKLVLLHPQRLPATAPENLLQTLEASLKKVA